MDNEGYDVARALAAKGIAAFVIKYRLRQTPADMAGFEKSMQDMFSGAARAPLPAANNAATDLAPQLADSIAAFRLIRSRATQW
ncbi:hypothetical protein NL449_28445, partial [Klebsiella pneumoniae]|nr:hypothetical protein [Klebsiella pneumoniae]